jgi:hypothetical protein
MHFDSRVAQGIAQDINEFSVVSRASNDRACNFCIRIARLGSWRIPKVSSAYVDTSRTPRECLSVKGACELRECPDDTRGIARGHEKRRDCRRGHHMREILLAQGGAAFFKNAQNPRAFSRAIEHFNEKRCACLGYLARFAHDTYIAWISREELATFRAFCGAY